MRNSGLAVFVSFVFVTAFAASVSPGPGQLSEWQGVPHASSAASSGGRSGALEALEFWSASRAYPEMDIPPDRYFPEYVRVKSELRKSSDRSTSTPPWEFLGPVNFAGRMIGIAINPLDPKTIYAGAASGGLWRTRSFIVGDWERVETGFPVLGVNAIAINPADTSEIYIGTGETYRYQGSVGGQVIRTTRGSYGMGILKTTDGGATWSQSLDWSYHQQRGVQAIRLNPLNPSSVFAATSEGVYKSTDAGGTWLPVLEVLMARDIAIHPLDTMRVLATCGNFASTGTGVYSSLDGGESFEKIQSLPDFSGMARLGVFKKSPDLVYVSLAESTTVIGELWSSTDFGSTWQHVKTDNNGDVQGWYARFLAIHPGDASQIIQGAQGLWKSTDWGANFTRSNDCWADFHDFVHHPTDTNTIYVVDDGGVWRSTDFGDSYQFIGHGLQTSQFYSGFSSSATDSLLALGQVQDHFGWMYTGSENWPQGGVDEVGWTAIDPVSDSIMYAVSRGGRGVFKSVDRGRSYFQIGSSFGGVGGWNSPIVLSPSHTSILYFGRSRVYKTTNGGGTWLLTGGGTDLDGNPALSMAISATSPDTVLVGTAPGAARPHIFRTIDGGDTWDDVTRWLPNRYPMDLAVDPTDSRVIYAVFGGFDTTRVAKSTNVGITWTDVSGNLPNVPTTAVAVDPFAPEHVYVGNDIGVFVSTNGGGGWERFDEGLPEALLVSDLSISPSNQSIKAASHSNGVYERKLLVPQVTGVAEAATDVPVGMVLRQNYPNPFNPSTQIEFQVAVPAEVTLKIYSLAGEELLTLVHGPKPAGVHTLDFNGSGLASGIYIYELVAGPVRAARKMILLK
ncbi:MAG: T9SS type A sorting domain-containing protein [Bacteroidota bacterium]